jgi:BirA family biotin operon repressor/biotin-[acetyl-CoA-carboxylase] ligase
MTIGRPLIRLDQVTSTMDLARQLANQGAAPGTAVLAGYQSQGKGRAGRQWNAAPRSSILVSFITASQRRMDSLGLLSLAWGLAVAETVDTVTGSQSQVKWPNDVLVNGRKVAGILVTNGIQPGTGAYRQVTGIGLNCSTQEPDLPASATSLAIETGQAPNFDLVLRELFRRLESVYATLESGDERSVLDRLAQRLAFMDELVLVQDGNRSQSGIVRGVDHQGALLVEDASGTIQHIVAGDLTRGPRRSA